MDNVQAVYYIILATSKRDYRTLRNGLCMISTSVQLLKDKNSPDRHCTTRARGPMRHAAACVE